jgi:hypothetical protein
MASETKTLTDKQRLTFPIGRRPLSKKRIIPRNENRTPSPVSPIPISAPSSHPQNVSDFLNPSRKIQPDKQMIVF